MNEKNVEQRTAQAEPAPNNVEVAPSIAQATPEGADLPIVDEEWLDLWTPECLRISPQIARALLSLCSRAEKETRAALAATAAAEPVYQVLSIIAPDAWCDVAKEKMHECHVAGYEVRTLYRAAPPQQIDTTKGESQ